MDDLISRQAAIDAMNGIINRFEQILRHIRESKLDDSVCGMCEYDGAYIGQSGDWCNECPGFYKDDCFKLSDECRKRWIDTITKALPSAQPEQRWIPCSERLPENGHYYLWCSDMGRVQSDYYWDGFENGMKYGYNIAAWMPLPEPWKGEEDG